MRTGRRQGYVLVIIAAALWATMGLFYKGLMAHYTLPALTIVFWRAVVAALALFLYLRLRGIPWRIARRDVPLFLGFGALGIAAFYALYIRAIAWSGMGMAAVLMYTAPVWVTLYGALVLGEGLNRVKAAALGLALVGCVLVSRLYDESARSLNTAGILAGLGAGVTYGSYILFSRATARRGYAPWVAQAWALALGGLGLLPWQTAEGLLVPWRTPALAWWLLLLGLVPTLGGGVAFTAALRSVTASEASIVATLEPVLAAFLGWAVWQEQLDGVQLLGAGLILVAVIAIQRRG